MEEGGERKAKGMIKLREWKGEGGRGEREGRGCGRERGSGSEAGVRITAEVANNRGRRREGGKQVKER